MKGSKAMETEIMNEKSEEQQTVKKRSSQKIAKGCSIKLSGEAKKKFDCIMAKLKERGIDKIDNKIKDSLISAALVLVPENYWDKAVKELTPLEFSIKRLMEDPGKRVKLEEFVESILV